MLRNGYANINNKASFSIEVVTCNEVWRSNGETCASEEEIRDFVSHIVIT